MAYLKQGDYFYQIFNSLLKWSSDGENINEEVETTIESLSVSKILVSKGTLCNGKEDSKLIESSSLEVN